MTVSPAMVPGSLQEILDRHYPFAVVAERNGWSIVFPDLPGCSSYAESWAEIGTQAEDALATWIEASLEMGHPIPDPTEDWNPVDMRPSDFQVATMTVADMAEQLGVTERRVQALASSRGIGRRFGRALMFVPADVNALRPGKPGRPSRSDL